MKKILLFVLLNVAIGYAQLVNPVFTVSQKTFLDTSYINNNDTLNQRTFSDLKYQTKAFLNVKDFGAVGDSTQNDSPAIQDAINSFGAKVWSDDWGNYQGVVYLPQGQYILQDSLILKTGITIMGEGVGNTMLYVNDHSAFYLNGEQDIKISGLTIRGAYTYPATTDANGINFGAGGANIELSDVKFVQLNTALLLPDYGSLVHLIVKDCYFGYNKGYCFYSGEFSQLNSITFLYNRFEETYKSHIRIDGSGNATGGVDFYYNVFESIRANYSIDLEYNAWNYAFIGNHFENNCYLATGLAADIHIGNGSKSIQISNNMFSTNNASPDSFYSIIADEGVEYLTVTNNRGIYTGRSNFKGFLRPPFYAGGQDPSTGMFTIFGNSITADIQIDTITYVNGFEVDDINTLNTSVDTLEYKSDFINIISSRTTYPELIRDNGQDDPNAFWSFEASSEVSGGKLRLLANAGRVYGEYGFDVMEVGENYILTFDIDTTSDGFLRVGNGTDTYEDITTTGAKIINITATTNGKLLFMQFGTGRTVIDNVYLHKPDILPTTQLYGEVNIDTINTEKITIGANGITIDSTKIINNQLNFYNNDVSYMSLPDTGSVTDGYIPKRVGNDIVWSPDISTSGAGTFNPDGITIDTTAGGLARVLPSKVTKWDSVTVLTANKFNTADTTAFNSKTLTTAQLAYKLDKADTTNFRTFSNLKYLDKSDTSVFVSDALLNALLTYKQNTLVSGSNIRTVNGNSLLGSTDLVISGTLDSGVVNDLIGTYLDTLTSDTSTHTMAEIDKAVDNTLYSVIKLNPTSNTTFTLLRTKAETIIDSVFCLVQGAGASVDFNIAYGTNRTSGTDIFGSDQTADNITVGETFTTFSSATIPVNNMIWLDITTATNTPTEFLCVIYYH